MSGHFRFEIATFLVVAGFGTPAASNPLTDLFSPNAAPAAAAVAPDPAQEECLLQPGKSVAPGQHWVYHHDGHRKCWFQAEASTPLARKAVHRHVARQRAAPEENEAAPRKQEEAVEDARAEMLSAAPAEASKPASHAPEIKLVDATPIHAASAAALAPAAPVVANAASDQVTPNRPTPPQLNEETLLAAASATPDAVDTSAISAGPIAVSAPETREVGGWSMVSWLGVLLMALGGVALLGASRTRHRAA
jgi:hypothetical protein